MPFMSRAGRPWACERRSEVPPIEDPADSRAFDEALERLRRNVGSAFARQEDWPHGVAAGISATLTLSAVDPATMRTLLVDVFATGPGGPFHYRRLVDHFTACLAEGRSQCGDSGEALPAVIEEALIGAVSGPIATAVRTGRHEDLPALAPQLIEFVLTPYLGDADAKRVAAAELS